MVDEPQNAREDKDFLQLVASKSTGSEWIAWYENNDTAESICQVPTKMKIRETTRLAFSSKNISSLVFTWVAEAGKNILKPDNDSIIGGFQINWHEGSMTQQEDLKGKEANNWKLITSYKNSDTWSSKSMRLVLNLVREAKKHKLNEKDIWDSVLKQRRDMYILNQNIPCLNEIGTYHMIIRVAQDLDLTIGFEGWIPEADLGLGHSLLSAINDCSSDILIERAKLSVFFESLLTNHNLSTVVAATMNSIQPRGGDIVQDFTTINMWYEELDMRYNFSLGSIVVALSTTERLQRLKRLDPPFMKYVDGFSSKNLGVIDFSGKLLHTSMHIIQ